MTVRCPHNGTETSRDAAKAAESFAGTERERIIDFLDRQGSWGATAKDITRRFGLPVSNTSARFNGLRRDGLIFYKLDVDGNRVKRKGEGDKVASFVHVSARWASQKQMTARGPVGGAPVNSASNSNEQQRDIFMTDESGQGVMFG